MTRHRQKASPPIHAALVGAWIATFAACAIAPQPEPPSASPAIASADDVPQTPPPPSDENVNPWIGLDLFVLDIDADLQPAWRTLPDRHLSEQTLHTWHANGFEIALVGESEVREFLTHLPATTHHRAQVQKLTPDWAPLITSPPITGPMPIVWRSPARQDTHLQASRCRLQLLIRLTTDPTIQTTDHPSGQTPATTDPPPNEPHREQRTLAIVPHHHLVKPSVRVLTPREIALAGRIFDELTLSLPFPDEARWLIIGLTADAIPTPEPNRNQTGEDPAREMQPPPSRPLAWPILTGEQFKKPRQILMIAAINRWQPPAPK